MLPAYTYGALPSSTGSLTIPLILYCHLLAHCLTLWYSTTFYWLPVSLWYSITFYKVPAYHYGILLPSTGLLHIPMVLYYFLLANRLYPWYSTIFYWSLPVPMELYYLLLIPGLSIWYSTIFLCTYGTLLQSTDSLPTPILHYYLLHAPCLYLLYSTTF